MTYNEFQKLLVEHLKESIETACTAGSAATDQKEQGIYHGVVLQARQTLTLVYSLFVVDNRIPLSSSEFDAIIMAVDDDKLRQKLQSLKG